MGRRRSLLIIFDNRKPTRIESLQSEKNTEAIPPITDPNESQTTIKKPIKELP